MGPGPIGGASAFSSPPALDLAPKSARMRARPRDFPKDAANEGRAGPDTHRSGSPAYSASSPLVKTAAALDLPPELERMRAKAARPPQGRGHEGAGLWYATAPAPRLLRRGSYGISG